MMINSLQPVYWLFRDYFIMLFLCFNHSQDSRLLVALRNAKGINSNDFRISLVTSFYSQLIPTWYWDMYDLVEVCVGEDSISFIVIIYIYICS